MFYNVACVRGRSSKKNILDVFWTNGGVGGGGGHESTEQEEAK